MHLLLLASSTASSDTDLSWWKLLIPVLECCWPWFIYEYDAQENEEKIEHAILYV